MGLLAQAFAVKIVLSIVAKVNSPNMFPDRGCYFQVGDSLKLGMPISIAFRRALDTWASWVETMIHRNRTSVFFRTFESSHWRCVVLLVNMFALILC